MAALLVTYNVRSLLVRWKSTLLAIVGIGLAVAVFVSLLSMASGFRLPCVRPEVPRMGLCCNKAPNPSSRHRSARKPAIGSQSIHASRAEPMGNHLFLPSL